MRRSRGGLRRRGYSHLNVLVGCTDTELGRLVSFLVAFETERKDEIARLGIDGTTRHG